MSKIQQPERKFARRADADIKRFIGGILINNQQLYIRGLPDRMLVFGGKIAFLEYKASADSHIDKLQLHWLHRFQSEGAFVAVACPENWDIILQELAAYML